MEKIQLIFGLKFFTYGEMYDIIGTKTSLAEVFMFDGIENVKIVSVHQKANKPYIRIENRKTHSFFIRTGGSMLYDFGGEQMVAKEGELMFVPKGSTYEARALSENTRYSSIHFDADFLTAPMPRRYSLERFHEAEFIASNISDMWNFGAQAEKYHCISLFYSLLSYLSSEESTSHDKIKFNIISPAVEYLKKHIYDCELKVERLPRLCGISGTYFRQIFITRYGIPPRKYILAKRLSHAKSIIAGGDFDTISEVARLAGFSDPLYFSKAYKRVYGISPTEAAR